MKHTFGILLSLFLLLPASNAVAQRLNGIRVESHTPIEVFVDGVEVFASSGHYGSRQAVFSQNVRYSGSGIKDIFIDGNIDDDEIYLPGTLRPMDDRTFDEFLARVQAAKFDSDKKEIIEMATQTNLFFTSQVKALCQTYKFDSDRLWLLKQMYPYIVDRQRAFLLADLLSYSDLKEEFRKYAQSIDAGR